MLVILTFTVNAAFNLALGLLVAHFLGPEDFGRYALAQAIGIMLNTAAIDWVRLSATRFSSPRTDAEAPEVRGTLEAAFAVSSLGVALLAIGCAAAGVNFDLTVGLAGLIPAVAITNGLFDYHAALSRAQFKEQLYSRLVLVKNGLSLVLMVGGAWWFHEPAMVLVGMCVSLVAACLSVRRALEPKGGGVGDRAPGAEPHPQYSLERAWAYMGYALPIVVANSVYNLLPLYNRAAITATMGFAETGRYSLAYDIGVKLFSAVGSALDIMLFQLAVRREEQAGPEAARAQIARNIGVVLAVLAPMTLGLFFILPALDEVVVPALFRGSFSAYMTALLPGFFALALTLYALNAVFQISRRTFPIVVACVFSFALDAGLMRRLPADATGVDYAHVQALAMMAGLGVTILYVLITMPVHPRLRDLGAVLLASGAMAAVLAPLRGLAPSWHTLAGMVVLGAAVYGAVAWFADACGVRRLNVWRRLRSARATSSVA